MKHCCLCGGSGHSTPYCPWGRPGPALRDMEREIQRLSRDYARRQILENERQLQQLRDDTRASGAMPSEFQIVQVYRRGPPSFLQPRLR